MDIFVNILFIQLFFFVSPFPMLDSDPDRFGSLLELSIISFKIEKLELNIYKLIEEQHWANKEADLRNVKTILEEARRSKDISIKKSYYNKALAKLYALMVSNPTETISMDPQALEIWINEILDRAIGDLILSPLPHIGRHLSLGVHKPSGTPSQTPSQPIPNEVAAETPIEPTPGDVPAETPIEPTPGDVPAEVPIEPTPDDVPSETPIAPSPDNAPPDAPIAPDTLTPEQVHEEFLRKTFRNMNKEIELLQNKVLEQMADESLSEYRTMLESTNHILSVAAANNHDAVKKRATIDEAFNLYFSFESVLEEST